LGSEIFTVDRVLTDISSIKISHLYYVPSGQESPLSNGLLIKTSIFRVGFLSRNALAGEMTVRS
jgi:hypothetical protein